MIQQKLPFRRLSLAPKMVTVRHANRAGPMRIRRMERPERQNAFISFMMERLQELQSQSSRRLGAYAAPTTSQKPCVECRAVFTRTTLAIHGGKRCGRCSVNRKIRIELQRQLVEYCDQEQVDDDAIDLDAGDEEEEEEDNEGEEDEVHRYNNDDDDFADPDYEEEENEDEDEDDE